MTFAQGEIKSIKNSYDVGAGVVSGDSGFTFTYVVTSGARWNGNIEKAEFYIDLSDAPHSLLFPISPNPQSVMKGVYYLKFEDFKPNFNIEIRGSDLSGQISSAHYTVMEIMRGLVRNKFHDRKDGDHSFNTAKFEQFLEMRRPDLYTASLLRNLVFASHGRSFDTPWIREYFSKQNWYKVNKSYSDTMLTDDEKAFIAVIKLYENSLKQ